MDDDFNDYASMGPPMDFDEEAPPLPPEPDGLRGLDILVDDRLTSSFRHS